MPIKFYFVSLAVLWYVAVFSIAAALPDCKQSYVELSPGKTAIVNNAGYPRGFLVKSGCKTKIAAPIYHKIDISCHIYIGVDKNPCNIEDVLYLLVDGTTFIERGYKYCGSGRYISLQSSYNTVYIGYNATRYSGVYNCSFTATNMKPCTCGQRIKSRIIGGNLADLNAYPYMAAIMKTSSNRLNGGASIISSNTLYTAAHVFIANNQWMAPSDVYVTVGRNDLRKGVQYDSIYSAIYQIDRYIVHPKFNYDTGENDIAIVVLKEIMSFNRAVWPICLTGTNEAVDAYYGKTILLMGYGSFEFGSDFSNQLKIVTSKVILNKECAAVYNKNGKKIITTQDMCALSKGRNDTCQGDSGGPVVFEDYFDFLIGVVEDGPECGSGYPGIYQRSSYTISWVRQVVPRNNYFCTYKP